jgi:hypothetical protein
VSSLERVRKLIEVTPGEGQDLGRPEDYVYDHERKRWVPVESQTRDVCFGEGLSVRVRESRKRQGRKGVTNSWH